MDSSIVSSSFLNLLASVYRRGRDQFLSGLLKIVQRRECVEGWVQSVRVNAADDAH